MSKATGVQLLVLGAVAFAVGFVAGGFGPRGEVRRLEEERFELEKRAAARGGEARRELTRLVTGRLQAGDPGGGENPEFRPRTGPGADAAEPDPSAPGTPVDTDPAPELETPEAMREALTVRAALARAALVAEAEPSPEQQVAIDQAWSDMNDELDALARRAVEAFGEGEPSRRELMQLGSEVLDLLVVSEERVLNTLTPEQRERLAEDATDPTSFVDPRIVDVIGAMGGGP